MILPTAVMLLARYLPSLFRAPARVPKPSPDD
jgi:hypothetical protein